MPRPRMLARRWLRRRECADLLGVSLRTWDRYWPLHPELAPVELPEVLAGRNASPAKRWPEDAIARHMQQREQRRFA